MSLIQAQMQMYDTLLFVMSADYMQMNEMKWSLKTMMVKMNTGAL